MSLTRKQIETRARKALGLFNAEGYRRITKTHMHHIVEQAQQLVRVELMDRIEQFSGTFTANIRNFCLPSDFLKEYELFIAPNTTTGFQGYRAEPRPYRDLVPIQSRFDTNGSVVNTGEVVKYYYTITSDNVLYVEPLFAASTTFHLFYVRTPTVLAGDSSTPDFREPFAGELILGKCRYLCSIDAGLDPKITALQHSYYQQLFASHKPFSNSKNSLVTQIKMSY